MEMRMFVVVSVSDLNVAMMMSNGVKKTWNVWNDDASSGDDGGGHTSSPTGYGC